MRRSYHASLCAAAIILALPATALAQITAVTGHVTNASNQPVPSASVGIPSMAVGAMTDAEGKYSFTIPADRATGQSVALIVRRIGFTPQTRTVVLTPGGTVVQDFSLTAAVSRLEDVVVTALGQTREKSSLGTSVQQLSTEELTTTFAPNVENQLQGKVSGVNIVGNGTQGGSTSINIRGQTSISYNNQPLFVVDGIPVSNNDRGSQQQGGGMTGSKDFGNTIQDINPADIATLTVLKGPNAAALYGSRAANGAIIITTKRGMSGRSSMDATASVTYDTPAILPDFQNSYGQGSGGDFKWVNGLGALDGNDQSYGPRLDGRLIDQFTGPQQPWVAHPDNVSSFFNTGRTADATVGISGGTERANARLSINGENIDGVVPNNFFRRFGGLASGSLRPTDKLAIDGSLNYVRNDGLNRPGQGYVGGVMEGLYVWFGRQVDMNALKNQWRQSATKNNGPANREFNWNYSYHNNPYFMQYDNPEADQRDRVVASGSATYAFLPWLKGMVRTGTDTYRYNINANYSEGNIELNNGSSTVNPAYAGAFEDIADIFSENNTDALLTADRDLFSGLSLIANVGGNRRSSQQSTNSVTVNGITVGNIYNVSNAGLTPVNGTTITNQAVNSVYGSAALTWNRWFTLEGTARNDWSSTLPKGNNSYFYPSVDASVILTDALPSIKNDVLTFMKLRGGTARVGNDAPAYSLATTYIGNPSHFNGQPLFSLSNNLLNPNLRPETTVSNEGGIEFTLWDNRLSFDGSVYDKYTTDEITLVALPPTTGYGNKLVNAGKIDNRGIEALVTVEPYRSNDWGWTSTFSFSRNKSKVVSLFPGLTNIVFGGFQGSVQSEARVGEPFGTIRGYGIKRDPATGLPLLANDGTYQATDTLQTFGSYQPDWTGGWVNQIRYGRFTLNSTIDVRRGGKLFSGTNFYGQATGTLASTMYGRTVDWNNPGIVIKGTIEETGQPNTTNITSEQYFQSLSYNGIAEPYVYDDSYIKLRELRLGWDLPASLAGRVNASSVNFALVGRNLWTHTNVPNIDPEITYNTGRNQGLEYAGLPAVRSLGFAVRVTQ
ncbi:MAG: SusC/RagA family TonB-linked outer membrane protein [Gemmatimonadaceae bacterium]